MRLLITANRACLCAPARQVLPLPAASHSLRSSFVGTSLRHTSGSGFAVATEFTRTGRKAVIVEANNKRSLGDTKRGTRRARTRTSGYRARRRTVGGRKVLTARRKKGRRTLCPANSRTGVKSTASSDRR